MPSGAGSPARLLGATTNLCRRVSSATVEGARPSARRSRGPLPVVEHVLDRDALVLHEPGIRRGGAGFAPFFAFFFAMVPPFLGGRLSRPLCNGGPPDSALHVSLGPGKLIKCFDKPENQGILFGHRKVGDFAQKLIRNMVVARRPGKQAHLSCRGNALFIFR